MHKNACQEMIDYAIIELFENKDAEDESGVHEILTWMSVTFNIWKLK